MHASLNTSGSYIPELPLRPNSVPVGLRRLAMGRSARHRARGNVAPELAATWMCTVLAISTAVAVCCGRREGLPFKTAWEYGDCHVQALVTLWSRYFRKKSTQQDHVNGCTAADECTGISGRVPDTGAAHLLQGHPLLQFGEGGGGLPSHGTPPPIKRGHPARLVDCFEMGRLRWTFGILLPSARHLEEGRGTTEAGKLHQRVVPQPPWEPPPPPNTQIG